MGRLIDRDIEGNLLAELLEADLCILGEFIREDRILKSANVLQPCRNVVMEQRHVGYDTALFAGLEHILIKGDSLHIHRAVPGGQNAGPGNGKAQGVVSTLFQQPNVLLVAVVKICRHIAGKSLGVFGAVTELIPVALSFSTLVPAALTLVCCAGRTPQKNFCSLFRSYFSSNLFHFELFALCCLSIIENRALFNTMHGFLNRFCKITGHLCHILIFPFRSSISQLFPPHRQRPPHGAAHKRSAFSGHFPCNAV